MKKSWYLFLFMTLLASVLPGQQADSLPGQVPSTDLFFSLPDEPAESSVQEVSPLLFAANDIFAQAAAINFAPLQFRARGISSRYFQLAANGLVLNAPSDDQAGWAFFGILQEVCRTRELRPFLSPARDQFGDAGGHAHLDLSASAVRKGIRSSVAAGNRLNGTRLFLSAATGLRPNGWAVNGGLSIRYSMLPLVPGTYLQSAGFLLSADKKTGRRRTGVCLFASGATQGLSSAAVQEVFDLTGDTHYNSSWGLQNGVMRNSRVRKTVAPGALLHHEWAPTTDLRLSTALLLKHARTGLSGIQRQNAPNPLPDQPQNLPSWHYERGDTARAMIAEDWWSEPENRQLNWDEMIHRNRSNLFSIPGREGLDAPNTTETRALYSVSEQVRQIRRLSWSLNLNLKKQRYLLSSGLSVSASRENYFREIADLLGADFWLDREELLAGSADERQQWNDIHHPYRKVREGDRYGYDYALVCRDLRSWIQYERSYAKGSWHIACQGSVRSARRHGNMENGRFPGASKTKSEKAGYLSEDLKAGFHHALSGRHHLSAQFFAGRRPPVAADLFLSPEHNDVVLGSLSQEQLTLADLSYHLRSRAWRMRFTLYDLRIRDGLWRRSYWDDREKATVLLVMDRINSRSLGLEAGVEHEIGRHLLSLALGLSDQRYVSRPELSAWRESDLSQLFVGRPVYLKNFRTAETPQHLATMGFRMNTRRREFLTITFNGAAGRFVAVNPARRTAESVGNFQNTDLAGLESFAGQEQMKPAFFINALAGKNWRTKNKSFLTLFLSANNLLHSKNIRASGAEQLRYLGGNPEAFPAKYRYAPGLNYSLHFSISF